MSRLRQSIFDMAVDQFTGDGLLMISLLLILPTIPTCFSELPSSVISEGQGNIVYDNQSSNIIVKQGLQLHIQDRYVVVDNGIVRVTISKPDGFMTAIQYNGGDNVLAGDNNENDRGFWDLVWSKEGRKGTGGDSEKVNSKLFKVIRETEEQIELSFLKTWDPSDLGKLAPLKIDKRFVMLRRSSGFYSYAIYEHLEEWPAFNFPRTRLIFKLQEDKFRYMVISDNRQRFMPTQNDRSAIRSQQLAYPEAVILVNPVEPEFKGEVDDKYQYSTQIKDLKVHGWINPNESLGFWQIIPSIEFQSGGPLRQELSSHVGPSNLAIFHSPHNVGDDLVLKFKQGEPWKKVFGPVFTYLNSGLKGTHQKRQLWEDAKKQMMVEVNNWPYSFPVSEDFPKSEQRGTVHGRLLVLDRFVSTKIFPANGSLVGLAPPGGTGSWQMEGKGYQFWSVADDDGVFSIDHVRAGNYNIFAVIPGFVGEYHNMSVITISPGGKIHMGEIIYTPPRDGPTLWEIGFPDRLAAEFYIPDPNPKFINKLYVNHPDRYRQYGLWERYTDLYPAEDLVYNVGSSNHKKDWFFAQVTRNVGNGSYQGTTWQIKFMLQNVTQTANYTLRLALASMHASILQVRINDEKNTPLFSTNATGKDNAIARHGIHGFYYLFNVKVPPSLLFRGNNTIFLTQPLCTTPFHGIMYDYIRLEAPNNQSEAAHSPPKSHSRPLASSSRLLMVAVMVLLLSMAL